MYLNCAESILRLDVGTIYFGYFIAAMEAFERRSTASSILLRRNISRTSKAASPDVEPSAKIPAVIGCSRSQNDAAVPAHVSEDGELFSSSSRKARAGFRAGGAHIY